MQRVTFSRARKKNRILSGCRKSVCCILDFLLVGCVSSKGPCCDYDAESIDTASMASAATSGASGFLLGDDAAEFMRQRGEQT